VDDQELEEVNQQTAGDRLRAANSAASRKLAMVSAFGVEQSGKLSGLIRKATGQAGEFAGQLNAGLEIGRSVAARRLGEATATLRQGSSMPWKLLVTPSTTPPVLPPDLSTVSEEWRLAYYGALIALGGADGHLDRSELEFLLDSTESDHLGANAMMELKGYLLQPPDLVECLTVLSDGEESLRFGLLFQLVEVAHADDVVQAEERQALDRACEILRATPEQLEAIERFVLEARRLEVRGKNDRVATECLKQAAGGLSSVGVPIGAVYFSGSVVGLSASGITSGLAALGLGFGMVSGIAVAVALGTGTYFGLGRILDMGGGRQRALRAAESERRAQLVIKHLQDALREVMERISELQDAADTAEENRQAIAMLRERMRTFQSIIARKQLSLETNARA
jgi:hypothetical protein